MSWINQKPFVVTSLDLKLQWGCRKPGDGLRCGFCGHKFTKGETARWVYTNDTPGAGGNTFVCQPCDGPRDVLIEKLKAQVAEFNSPKFWRLRG